MRRLCGMFLALSLAAAAPVGAEPEPAEAAERYNEQGKSLFSRGELETAARKFRAAIAIDPQARYFFNLCFVLNARYQLDAALGACGEVGEAKGADARLRKRAAELIEVIRNKQRAQRDRQEKPEENPGEESPAGDGDGGGTNEGGDRVAAGDSEPDEPDDRPATKPVAYPVPMGGESKRVAIEAAPEPPPRAYHLGLVTGLSFASHSEALLGDSELRTGFAVGGFFATSFSRILAGQLELLYVQKGASGDEGDIALDYISVPAIAKLMMKAGSTARFHADAGFSLSFLASAEGTDEFGLPMDIGDQVSSFDVGLVLGGGVTWHRRGQSAWLLDVRHERGLTDVDMLPEFSVKSRVTTLRVGYAF